MTIFDFDDYKKYVNTRIYSMPQHGRGQFRQIANYLKTNSVVISQIFKGTRELSIEQTFLLTKYFGLNEKEQEYLILLVQKARASHFELKKYFEQKIKKLKIESQELKNIVKEERLPEEVQSLFYSNWYYSAVRLSAAISGNDSIDKISHFLKLPRSRVQQVVDFLLKYGLIVEEKGRLKPGPRSTHLDASSPFINRHHINWRLKGTENMEDLSPHEIFYTAPMSLSQGAFEEIKKLVLEFITRKDSIIKPAADEKLGCINIDLFEF